MSLESLAAVESAVRERPSLEGLIRVASPPFRAFFRLMGGYRSSGQENIPTSGPVILAGNHLSWADPPAVRIALSRITWFMANDFLFKLPLFGPLIHGVGAFPVVRGRFDREAFKAAEAKLGQGDMLCLFPEGGTTLSGHLSPFEGGVALLAARTGAPIVPFALTGTDRIMPMTLKGPKFPRYAKGGVAIRFGPPLRLEDMAPGLSRRERMDALTFRLYKAVEAMLPPDYVALEPWDGSAFRTEHPER